MLIKRYLTSMMNMDYVQLPDGEELPAPDAAANAKVYGMYVVSGEYAIGDQRFTAGAGFIINDIDYAATAKASGDTIWFCASQNDDVRRNVSALTVAGTATLPANTGFFVIEGTVECDGKTANQFQFFKPRPTTLEVQGNGVLMLVE
jgi:hypothetical protein